MRPPEDAGPPKKLRRKSQKLAGRFLARNLESSPYSRASGPLLPPRGLPQQPTCHQAGELSSKDLPCAHCAQSCVPWGDITSPLLATLAHPTAQSHGASQNPVSPTSSIRLSPCVLSEAAWCDFSHGSRDLLAIGLMALWKLYSRALFSPLSW